MRRALDRLLGLAARGLVAGLFRRYEVTGNRPKVGERPVLLVANHFNGFVDPVAATAALGRLPRFLAKATLGNILPVKWLLNAVGVVLVQRRVDQPDGSPSNESAFAACHRTLARNATVAIFPEGTTHDLPHMVRMHTGAARIAIGALQYGVETMQIIPVGLSYDDKIAFRSGVLVEFGEPIDVAAELARLGHRDATEDDREAVRLLTEVIDERLRRVAPDFETVEEWRTLERAAAVTLATERRPEPPLAETTRLARRLGDTSPAVRDGVRTALADYMLLLGLFHLDDRQLVWRVRRRDLLRSIAVLGVVYLLTGPFVLSGVVANAVPVIVVAGISLWVRTPVTKGTVRVLVGVIVFPVSWFVAASLVTDGTVAVTLTALAFGAAGFLALLWIEGVIRLIRTVVSWRVSTERSALIEPLTLSRQAVVDAVKAAAPDRPVSDSPVSVSSTPPTPPR